MKTTTLFLLTANSSLQLLQNHKGKYISALNYIFRKKVHIFVNNDPNPQDSGPSQPPRSTTCKFYAQGTCKHGRRGLSCQYNHPRMCKSFIKSGVRGCKRGTSCSFFHPRLCPQSLHHNQCIRKRCFLYHVTGSERPNYIPLNPEQHNPNSRPQNCLPPRKETAVRKPHQGLFNIVPMTLTM